MNYLFTDICISPFLRQGIRNTTPLNTQGQSANSPPTKTRDPMQEVTLGTWKISNEIKWILNHGVKFMHIVIQRHSKLRQVLNASVIESVNPHAAIIQRWLINKGIGNHLNTLPPFLNLYDDYHQPLESDRELPEKFINPNGLSQ